MFLGRYTMNDCNYERRCGVHVFTAMYYYLGMSVLIYKPEHGSRVVLIECLAQFAGLAKVGENVTTEFVNQFRV
jgi:hypothetical protein